ncbi:Thioredoxin superfamily protein [Raphanus sativus]|nr:Thioredoxin superfamily protein [Raphanus sativus]
MLYFSIECFSRFACLASTTAVTLPKELGPSRFIHFTSEREFVQLLHQGYPVVVAFTISNYTQHLDRMLEEAAAEFYPNIKFMRAGNEGKVQDPNITRYSVKVVPSLNIAFLFVSFGRYNYDMSPYGFREFFKRQGVRTSDP